MPTPIHSVGHRLNLEDSAEVKFELPAVSSYCRFLIEFDLNDSVVLWKLQEFRSPREERSPIKNSRERPGKTREKNKSNERRLKPGNDNNRRPTTRRPSNSNDRDRGPATSRRSSNNDRRRNWKNKRIILIFSWIYFLKAANKHVCLNR